MTRLFDTQDADHQAITGTAVMFPGRPTIGMPDGGMPYEVDCCTPEHWSRMLAEFDDATFDQTCVHASHLWGDERLSHILIRENGRVAAAAQLVLLTLPFARAGMAYLKFGPVWQRKGETANPQALRKIVSAIKQEYAMRRGLLVMALLPPDPENGRLAETIMMAHGFSIRRKMADPNRYLVDATLSDAEQMRSFKQKWRYNLKKSLANGLDISVYEAEEGLPLFQSLYDEMVSRKKFSDASAAETLPAFFDEACPATRPHIVIASHEGRPTAAAVVGHIGRTATYLFGATDERALELKAGYALHWWIIRWLRERDVRWYDLGGEAQDAGLRQFKTGMTGKAGRIIEFAGEYEYCRSPISRAVAGGALAFRTLRRETKSLGLKLVHRPHWK